MAKRIILQNNKILIPRIQNKRKLLIDESEDQAYEYLVTFQFSSNNTSSNWTLYIDNESVNGFSHTLQEGNHSWSFVDNSGKYVTQAGTFYLMNNKNITINLFEVPPVSVSGTVRIYVSFNGVEVNDANVIVAGVSKNAGVSGYYVFENVQASSSISWVVIKEGYETQQGTVSVSVGNTTEKNVTLVSTSNVKVFAAVSDFHVEDQNSYNTAIEVLSKMKAKGAQWIISCGDMIDNGNSSWRNQLTVLHSTFGQENLYPSRGNHEGNNPTGQNTPAVPDLMAEFSFINSEKTAGRIFGWPNDNTNNCYYFLRERILFICLDTSPYNMDGHNYWFNTMIPEAKSRFADQYDFMIIYHHKSTKSMSWHFNRPAMSGSSSDTSEPVGWMMNGNFDKKMIEAGADLVIAGHDHMYVRTKPLKATSTWKVVPVSEGERGTVFVTCGSGSGNKMYNALSADRTNVNYPTNANGGTGSINRTQWPNSGTARNPSDANATGFDNLPNFLAFFDESQISYTTTQQRTPDATKALYNIIEKDGDTLTFTAHRNNGEILDQFTITKRQPPPIVADTRAYDTTDGEIYDVIEAVGLYWTTKNYRNASSGRFNSTNSQEPFTDAGRVYTWQEASANAANLVTKGDNTGGWRLPTENEFLALKASVSLETDLTKSGSGNGAWTASGSITHNDTIGFGLLPGGYYDGTLGHYLKERAAIWLNGITNRRIYIMYNSSTFTAPDTAQSGRENSVRYVKPIPEVTVLPFGITLNQSTGGTFSSNKNTANAGETVTLSNTPQTGYRFVNYIVDGVSQTSNTFTMPQKNVSIYIVFEKIAYTIYKNVQNGSVTCPSTANYGDVITLSNTPDVGYDFVSYSVIANGTNISLSNGNQFTMPASDVSITAIFENSSNTISIVSNVITTLTVTAGNITEFISFECDITNKANLSYQWYELTSGLISGATSSRFDIPLGLTAGTKTYYCIASGTNATDVRSNNCVVTIINNNNNNNNKVNLSFGNELGITVNEGETKTIVLKQGSGNSGSCVFFTTTWHNTLSDIFKISLDRDCPSGHSYPWDDSNITMTAVQGEQNTYKVSGTWLGSGKLRVLGTWYGSVSDLNDLEITITAYKTITLFWKSSTN